ncbi:MAG: hypothetical protein ACKO3P_03890, partial [Planctomycetaceae bacterium]
MSNTTITNDQPAAQIAKFLTAEVRKELTQCSTGWLSDKKNVLEIANRVVAEFDAVDPALGSAID